MTLPHRPKADRPFAAMAWMLGAITSFAAIAIAARAVAPVHDTFEILAYRSVLGVTLVGVVAMARGRVGRISARRVHLHVFRNLSHFTGQALWFWALTQISLAQVFALEFTTPLWVVLLAPLALNEPLTHTRLFATGLGVLGVLLVARPDFGAPTAGLGAAALCAVFFAMTILMTKRLTRDEDVISILFWLAAMQSVLGLALAGSDGAMALPTVATLPWLGLIGVAGLCAHLSLTTALSLAPAGFVGTVDFARLPVIAVIGAVFYDEPLGNTLMLGAALILAGNALSLRAAQKPAHAPAPH